MRWRPANWKRQPLLLGEHRKSNSSDELGEPLAVGQLLILIPLIWQSFLLATLSIIFHHVISSIAL
jgi:hypothetical protein